MNLPLVPPDTAWGVGLALVAMLIYGACMVMVSASDHGQKLGSGPGSMLAALAGIPTGFVLAAWRGVKEILQNFPRCLVGVSRRWQSHGHEAKQP